MTTLLQRFRARGFIEQTTHEAELEDYLQQPETFCYIGFDPTAASLHIGHLIPIMALAFMQREGKRPIALVGGGTGLVGDPSGKTETRKLLDANEVAQNALAIKQQLSRFISFDDGKALLLNNADWLVGLEYISFLRDIGRHFSVNRMIKSESYRQRLEAEEGLNFIEFNYMLLQAYDFLKLSEKQNCRLQMGGSDQWGNIVAGIDLIRRVHQKPAFGITFPLITTSSGAKMGKTVKGAVWLDAQKTSAYDYYQFWVNTEDKDVGRFLALFTFLPLTDIEAVAGLEGADCNAAKRVLAFEATCIAHGLESATGAHQAAGALFGSQMRIPQNMCPSSAVPRQAEAPSDVATPSIILPQSLIDQGIAMFKLIHAAGMVTSGAAARRLIEQGGAYINGNRIEQFDYQVTVRDLFDSQITLRVGKKKFVKISFS